MKNRISRRSALARTGLLVGVALGVDKLGMVRGCAAPPAAPGRGPFVFCLNTATLRGQKLGIVKEAEIAAKAGYDAIEPWVDSIQEYVKSGGTTKELRQRINDLGLGVESAIGFPEWIVDDEQRRAKGFERAKQEMELVAQIGGK